MAKDVATLRALAKSVLALRDLSTSPAERWEAGGRFVAEAFKCGALGHSEKVDCRIHVEMRLAHTGVNPFISAWAEAGDRLRHGVGPFPPRDLDSDFAEDCELIANTLMAEADRTDQQPSGQTEPTPKTDSTLIYQADAATFYNIPKSTLSKASKKQPGEPGYLWSGRHGARVFYRKADLARLARSRKKLTGQ